MTYTLRLDMYFVKQEIHKKTRQKFKSHQHAIILYSFPKHRISFDRNFDWTFPKWRILNHKRNFVVESTKKTETSTTALNSSWWKFRNNTYLRLSRTPLWRLYERSVKTGSGHPGEMSPRKKRIRSKNHASSKTPSRNNGAVGSRYSCYDSYSDSNTPP